MSEPDLPQRLSLEDSILDLLMRAGARTLSAPEIAHAMAPEGDWHGLLVPIRRAAVALAQAGRLVIYRKGKPADPSDFPWRLSPRLAAPGLGVSLPLPCGRG